MKKIKVLQFAVHERMGGQTQYILNNWKHIDKSKFIFDFVTFCKSFPPAEELAREGCKTFYMSCYPASDEARFAREFSEVLKNGYDVVHLHTGSWSGTQAEQIARQCGVPKIIIHSHNTSFFKASDRQSEQEGIKIHNRIRSSLTEDIADEFLACSIPAAQWLYGNRIPKDRITIMKNAVNAEKYVYSESVRNAVRTELNLRDKFVIGNVGRMVYQKNQEFLLDVLKIILHDIPEAVLVIAGDGEERGNLERKIREYNIENNVCLLGQRSDIDALMQAIDVFCLPSRFEGLPIVMIEAQASGVFCLCSDTVSGEVCITENVKQIPIDAAAWAAELKSLFKNKYERKNTYDDIKRSGYDIKTQIKVLEQIYSN